MPRVLESLAPEHPGAALVSGSRALRHPETGALALAAALAWLDERHRASLGVEVVGPAELERWVEAPLAALADVVAVPRAGDGLAALRRRLVHELAACTVVVADLIGDLPPERWWFTATGDEVAAVDVGPTRARGLPEVELVGAVLTRRRVIGGRRRAGGPDPVLDLLANGWSPEEQAAAGPSWSRNVEIRPTTIVLLAWLQWAEAELADASGTPPAPLVRDIEQVLAKIADDERVAAGTEVEERPAPAPVPAERAARAVADATERATSRAGGRHRTTGMIAGLVVGAGLWVWGSWHVDLNAMTDLGLLSILRPEAFLGLAVLLACLCSELVSARPATWRLAAPLVTLVALLHGTPALLYGTLRYSWAWKHLGILDYIHRHGGVDPSIGPLGVYHNWPGFFSATSALADLFGLDGGLQVARWWPVVANLAVIPVLLFVYRGLQGGDDRRTGWLAVGFFLVANWIGQDYFSPQSLAFLLYLVIIGVVLHRFRVHPLRGDRADEPAWSDRWAIGIVLLAAAAIVSSHQVSPFMLVVALGALAVTRQTRTLWLTAATVGMGVVWSLTGAWQYMRGNVASLLSSVGTPVSNADGNLVDQGQLSSQQVIVSTMGRITVLAIAVIAVLGLVAAVRRHTTDRAALVLLLAPGALLFANSFGGEIGFRSYLFALPFLSWFGARAVWPPERAGGAARSRRTALVRGTAAFVVASVLLSGFLFGYYGKDRWYRFTRSEVAAEDLVLRTAASPSLMVTITANYPGPWKNYERLVFVPVAVEPAASRARVLARPAVVLAGWLSSPKYAGGFILLTRSQEQEVNALGAMPKGSVGRIRASLDASPQFRKVFDSPDAQVYVLAHPRRPSPPKAKAS
ncbi:MAG: hypothetical protein JWM05_954 [Acidimicrobiales bacterium]|nr:hypothetical protein [Acidimicrobiales bacterium]